MAISISAVAAYIMVTKINHMILMTASAIIITAITTQIRNH